MSETRKSTITIEKEYLDNEKGIPSVKRVIKEDGKIIYDDFVPLSAVEIQDTKINIFERWINYLKNPDDYKKNKIKGVFTIAGHENNPNKPIIVVNPISLGDGLLVPIS